jgi:probable HAF family extracellular repeat protein
MTMKTHQVPRPAGYLLAVLLLSVVPGQALADFVPLGDLPGGPFASLAKSLSADGATVVGTSASTFGPILGEAFVWTRTNGMVGLGTLPGYPNSRANAVSGDGTVVVGWSQQQNLFEAFRWTQVTGMVSLGSANTLAWGVSSDGAVVVGQFLDGGAFRWTQATGFVGIGEGIASSVSADGTVVVGGTAALSFPVAFRWTQATGQVSLGFLPLGQFSAAADVSADGAVVVGASSNATGKTEAFRWVQATGMIGLGDLPGGEFFSGARAVSADGAVIVGDSVSAMGIEAFLWDEANGMRSLRDVLIAQGDDLKGWQLIEAADVSADGRTIVGFGINPAGVSEAWLARLAPVPSGNIDIRPGSFTNSINPKSKGTIPVVILTTDSFDATTVDPTTVLFGRTGTEAPPVHFTFEDGDGDGDIDMTFHFQTEETGILCGDTSASLTGKTFGGQMVEEADSIKTVGCK